MSDFENALQRVLLAEGGWSDHPLDRGGETIFGISRKYHPTWDGWKLLDTLRRRATVVGGAPGFPQSAERDPMLLGWVRQFYFTEFWTPISGDTIPPPRLASALFSIAVVSGVTTAVKFLQDGLNTLAMDGSGQQRYRLLQVDGVCGPNTQQAIRDHYTPGRLDRTRDPLTWHVIALWTARCAEIIRHDPTQGVFARGWLNRAMGMWDG